MKKLSILIWTLVCPLNVFSQYEVFTPGPQENARQEISALELLRQRYIGKHILFFPRTESSRSEWQYYGNFYAEDPVELMRPYAVTLETGRDRRLSMHMKGTRKLHKLQSSIRYESRKLDDYSDVFDDGFIHGSTVKFPVGHFTPYEMIEGREFLVRDIRGQDCMNRNILYGLKNQPLSLLFFKWDVPVYIFELEDSKGQTLYWLTNQNHDPAGCIVEELDSLSGRYLGNAFYIRPPKPGHGATTIAELNSGNKVAYHERLSAQNILMIGDDIRYCTPHLVLEDDSGTLYKMELIKPLRVYEYQRTRRYDPSPETVDAARYLVPESIIIAEKEAEEQRQRELAARRQKEAERSRQESARREELFKAEQEQIQRDLAAKYGRRNAELIMAGRVALGMTKAMCIDAWGEPYSINRTITTYGTSEQWVYDIGVYLYFEGNKLTGIQD